MTIRSHVRSALLAAALLPLSAAALADHPGDKPHHHGPATAATAPVTAADAAKATRTVEVTLEDLMVTPATLSVKAGETVRFVVRNQGTLLHSFDLGTPEQQAKAQEHTAMMVQHGMVTDTAVAKMDMDHGGHDMGHADMGTLLVEPGATAEGTWTFSEAATLEFACSMPGHYEAGMAGRLDVVR